MEFGSKLSYIPNNEDEDYESIEEDDLNEGIQVSIQREKEKKEKKSDKKKIKIKGANTNVVSLELGKLGESATIATGDAVYCKNCKSMLNFVSTIKSFDSINNRKWNCEFCQCDNEIDIDDEEMPKVDTLDYLLEPSPMLNENLGDNNTVLFLVDISGSMCVTKEVQGKIELKGAFDAKSLNIDTEGQDQYMPNQDRNVTYISRLQCVQASIEKQVQTFTKLNPNKKVGLITFNNEINVIGDGSGVPITIGGDKLDNFDKLLEEGKKISIQKSIKETHDKIIDKLYKLQESGTTALGPALVIALGIISNLGKGNTIVLLTDGLANVGVGAMEDLKTEEDKTNAQLFYRKVGEYAQQYGTSISITSIEGSECKMENLGLVTELTNGEVNIVDPLELTNNFANILSKSIIATECNLVFKVHKGLSIKDDDNSDKEASDTFNKVIGNVSNDLTCTFEYSIKSAKELKELEMDKLEHLPFQVQIYYRDLSGAKKVRCITKQQKVTHQKEEAEKEIDMNVISANAVQGWAKLAQKGMYKKARQKMLLNQKIMNRNVSHQPKQEMYYQEYVKKAVQLDNALIEDVGDESDEDDDEQSLRNQKKLKSRKERRNDNVSKSIYRAKKWDYRRRSVERMPNVERKKSVERRRSRSRSKSPVISRRKKSIERAPNMERRRSVERKRSRSPVRRSTERGRSRERSLSPLNRRRSRSPSRSPERGRSRSRSRSPVYLRNRSRSPVRNPERGRSKSPVNRRRN